MASLQLVTENDDTAPGIRYSTVNFPAQYNTTYKIALDGWGNHRGNAVLNWHLIPETSTVNDWALY